MQVHWPLVISTACQRAGLGLLLCVVFANAVLGSQLPSNIACLVALALLCAGGIASVFHLQRPSRFFNAFSNPKSHLTQEGFITPFLGVALQALMESHSTLAQPARGFCASLPFWRSHFSYARDSHIR